MAEPSPGAPRRRRRERIPAAARALAVAGRVARSTVPVRFVVAGALAAVTVATAAVLPDTDPRPHDAPRTPARTVAAASPPVSASPSTGSASRRPTASRSTAPAPDAVPASLWDSRACPSPADLGLRGLLAQTLLVGVDGSSSAAVERLAGGRAPVGGVFVGGTATAAFRSGALRRVAKARVPLLVAVDEEGGRVQRIDALAGSEPSARTLGHRSSAAIQDAARRRGRELAELGVTVDLAPVVDLGGQPRTAVIGDRAFATSPDGVTRAAGAYARGLRKAGVLPVLKHFPGHGRAHGDSHAGASTTPPLGDLRRADLLPYRDLLDDGPAAVMMGHLTVPGLSGRDAEGRRLPASLDPAAYRLLRHDLGFTGVAVTDEVSGMRAVRDGFGTTAAIEQALRAGADLVLVDRPGSVAALLRSLAKAVEKGRLPRSRVEAAAARVMAAKSCSPSPAPTPTAGARGPS